ncbi:(Fe-S)-binding protein [Candidatus Sumerlaeota bacterium]|nr:(Fe-S)-binding protein [Candidatus Sumerlaeota bacterium]
MSDVIQPEVKPEKGMRAELMVTCLADAFYPAVGLAAAECLERVGLKVHFDERQTCCGQPAFNSGDRAAARKVARHTIEVFRHAELVVIPSGSCASMVRWGYPQLFRGERDEADAIALAKRTFELSELLCLMSDNQWEGRYARRITFHRSCHMRELSPGARPEDLLRCLDGIEMLDFDTPEQCCGFGGTFAVAFPWTSKTMGTKKLDALLKPEPEEIISSDMGCLMHLGGMQKKLLSEGKLKKEIPMKHFAQVLNEAGS